MMPYPRSRSAATLLLAAAALTFTTLGSPAVRADDPKPFLHPLFTDNMVLQRGQADPIWGWTVPGQSVTVSFHGKTAKAVAGPDGKWTARISPMSAGGPYTLTVSGPQTVTLTNVMVGDVWLCTGQSNMEFGVVDGQDADKEVAAADYPNIRILTVDHKSANAPQQTFTGTPWAVCTPDSIRKPGPGGFHGFSAVGYFFGRALYQNLHIPIGLIADNVGGTPAESWMGKDVLRQVPNYAAVSALYDIGTADPASQAQLSAGWYAKYDPGTPGSWQSAALDDTAWGSIAEPGYFQDAKIPELSSINGVVWFRRTFDLPAGDTGKAAVLHLKADDSDTTWLNGTLLGATDGAETERSYAVDPSLLKPTGNVVAVRVLDNGGKGGLHGDPADLRLEVPGGTDAALSGAWRYRIGVPFTLIGGSDLYNGMIAPLFPCGIKGAIWYQGENNAQSEARDMQYRTLLPAMIGGWRTGFGQGNFPFLIVQLAGFGPGDFWPDLRQAQWHTATTVPNTGIATAVDIGEQWNIHPHNKQETGRRLALVAEAKVYGEKVDYAGPVFKTLTVLGGAARLTFGHLGGGLVAKDDKPLTGFEIAGADGKFVPADAKIDGDTVAVSSPQVPLPVTVRYAWAGYPACSLYNKEGLPAFPFDTQP